MGQTDAQKADIPVASPTLLKFSYKYVTVFSISAQVMSITVAYLLYLLYGRRTRTHCATPNFWPSISKVTGNNLPERYIWRLAIALISFPKLMDGVLYHKFFSTRRPLCLQKKWYQWLNRFNSFLWVTQLFLFYTFVLVSSLESEDIHLFTWVVFLVFTLIHMVTFLVLFRYGSQETMQKKERISLTLRGIFFCVQLVAIAVFVFYGHMHSEYCQPYAYSIAALCENIIAASNLAFHGVQLLDFHSLEICYSFPWEKDSKLS